MSVDRAAIASSRPEAMNSLTAARVQAPGVHTPDRVRLTALSNALVLSAVTALAITFVLLFVFDGWTYYRTPRSIRAYVPVHRLLRPSGPIGQGLGLAGLLLMLVPMLYAVRKKSTRLANLGTMKTWLDLHIFAGIIGPVLVTFHTSFKFNGIVSVAYWMMVLVASSGLVGRYLYVRIPRSLRGTELTLEELRARAEELKTELAESGLPPWLIARLNDIEEQCRPSGIPGAWIVSLAVGDLALQLRLWQLRRDLVAAGASAAHGDSIVVLMSERAMVLRRLALLAKTKTLFELWHLFHQPLVYILFAIVLLHVFILTYMGYTIFSAWVPA